MIVSCRKQVSTKKKSSLPFLAAVLLLYVLAFFLLVRVFPTVDQRWIRLPLLLLAALVIGLKQYRDKA